MADYVVLGYKLSIARLSGQQRHSTERSRQLLTSGKGQRINGQQNERLFWWWLHSCLGAHRAVQCSMTHEGEKTDVPATIQAVHVTPKPPVSAQSDRVAVWAPVAKQRLCSRGSLLTSKRAGALSSSQVSSHSATLCKEESLMLYLVGMCLVFALHCWYLLAPRCDKLLSLTFWFSLWFVLSSMAIYTLSVFVELFSDTQNAMCMYTVNYHQCTTVRYSIRYWY